MLIFTAGIRGLPSEYPANDHIIVIRSTLKTKEIIVPINPSNYLPLTTREVCAVSQLDIFTEQLQSLLHPFPLFHCRLMAGRSGHMHKVIEEVRFFFCFRWSYESIHVDISKGGEDSSEICLRDLMEVNKCKACEFVFERADHVLKGSLPWEDVEIGQRQVLDLAVVTEKPLQIATAAFEAVQSQVAEFWESDFSCNAVENGACSVEVEIETHLKIRQALGVLQEGRQVCRPSVILRARS